MEITKLRRWPSPDCWIAGAELDAIPVHGKLDAISRPELRSMHRRRPAASATVSCPFDEKSASPPEFLEKLRGAFMARTPLPKAENYSRVLILYPDGWVGESEETQRMKECFVKRGDECCIATKNDPNVIAILNPSYVLSMDASIPPPATVPCAVKWHFPRGQNIRHALSYGNIMYSGPDSSKLNGMARSSDRKIRTIRIYPTTMKSEFCASPKRRLFYCGANWDERRKRRYANLYKLLDETDYFDIYGPDYAWKGKVKSYGGYIPNEAGALQNTMARAGVALVLHSSEHITWKLPTLRIFQAAAASCVIISDRNPFVVDNFGDSVLYIDQNASPEEIFRQIDGHMRWILEHPQEAIELARRAHAIFVEKFTLEGEIEKIDQFFKELQSAAA
ncbi:MAG: hypothetical protein LBB38_01135 [Puniceicoccales bacterium]|nr:hypothetical protein [Puniceicoccales bacterium]